MVDIFLAIIFLSEVILGLFVLQGKGAPNRKFALLIFMTAVWTVSNYLAEVIKSYLAVWTLIGITYSAAMVVGFLFLEFASLFSGTPIKVKKILFLFLIGFIGLSFSPLIIGKIDISGQINTVKEGPFLACFMFSFLAIIIYGFFILVGFYKRMKEDQHRRLQVQYVFAGTLLTIIGASLTNLFIPLFTGDSRMSQYGPYFVIFFITFTSYAILRHHLFNIKVVAVEILTAVIWVALFIQIFLSESANKFIINSFLFGLVFIFGILLIRSVLNEVRQKEQLAHLNNKLEDLNMNLERRVQEQTMEIRRAYEVEKEARREMEELDGMKTDFILTTQHHLRTPLTIVRGMISAVIGRNEEAFREIKYCCQGIRISCQRIFRNFTNGGREKLIGKKQSFVI